MADKGTEELRQRIMQQRRQARSRQLSQLLWRSMAFFAAAAVTFVVLLLAAWLLDWPSSARTPQADAPDPPDELTLPGDEPSDEDPPAKPPASTEPATTADTSSILTMFRGNPQRSLSGVGPVPRQPKLLWRFPTRTKYEGAYEQRGSKKLTASSPWSGLGWTGQPVRLGQYLYFGSADSYVYCINADAQKLSWYYPNHHCVKGSIAVFGDYIYHGGRDNKIHCYNLQGKMVWETRTGNDMDSSPVVHYGLGYIGGEDKYIYCFDPKTGEIVWKYGKAGGSFECSPCIAGNTVVMGNSRGELYCVDRITGDMRWQFNTRGDTDSTPIYHDGRLYVSCATGDEGEIGYLWCLSAASGKEIWHRQFSRGFWATAALNPEKDRLYIGNNNGTFYALSMETGKDHWTRYLYTRIWGSAAVTDGCVVVGVRDGRMWCLDENSGKPIWMFDAPFDIDATPCVAAGQIIIGDQGGWVYCIGEEDTNESVNRSWFVTKFPPSYRTNHNASGIKTINNPAAPPRTYMDTSSSSRENIFKPVYGPGYKP